MAPWTPSDDGLSLRARLALRAANVIRERAKTREEIKTARSTPAED